MKRRQRALELQQLRAKNFDVKAHAAAVGAPFALIKRKRNRPPRRRSQTNRTTASSELRARARAQDAV